MLALFLSTHRSTAHATFTLSLTHSYTDGRGCPANQERYSNSYPKHPVIFLRSVIRTCTHTLMEQPSGSGYLTQGQFDMQAEPENQPHALRIEDSRSASWATATQ